MRQAAGCHPTFMYFAKKPRRQIEPVAKGSFAELCVEYPKSKRYRELHPHTKHIHRRNIDRLCEKHSNKKASLVERSASRGNRRRLPVCLNREQYGSDAAADIQ